MRRVFAYAVCTIAVLFAALYFGGPKVAPCLGGPGAIQECVDAWRAAHPAPPPILDISLPWPWLVLHVVGLVTIFLLGRLRVLRSDRRATFEDTLPP